MSNRKNKKFLFTAAASLVSAGVYHYIKGTGIFNKYRFKNQHDAIARYVDAHYKGAYYSPINTIPNGWITVITTKDSNQITLTVTCSSDNMYIFKETPIE